MSALPKLFAPEEEPDLIDVREIERDVMTGRRCVECSEEFPSEHHAAPVICTACAMTYLTKLLDHLGYTLRRTRGKNAEGFAQLARLNKQRKAT